MSATIASAPCVPFSRTSFPHSPSTRALFHLVAVVRMLFPCVLYHRAAVAGAPTNHLSAQAPAQHGLLPHALAKPSVPDVSFVSVAAARCNAAVRAVICRDTAHCSTTTVGNIALRIVPQCAATRATSWCVSDRLRRGLGVTFGTGAARVAHHGLLQGGKLQRYW